MRIIMMSKKCIKSIDHINSNINGSRGYFNNVGKFKNTHKNKEITEAVASKILYCDKYALVEFIKYGLLKADFVYGKYYFLYSWIEDFANDNRLIDYDGNVAKITGYDTPSYVDEKGRTIVVPVIYWIDKDGNETTSPNSQNPPVSYRQYICLYGEKHKHSMGVGGRAQGYYLKPSLEDIDLIKKYNLHLGNNYSNIYVD